MKYQDLCIRLSEILRARGINTIYFEDVNLLNSEDVVYPAAVIQLVRVEQETQSDRYTIMVTIAKGCSMIKEVGSEDVVIRPNFNEIFPHMHYEVQAQYFYASNSTDSAFVYGKKRLIGDYPISINMQPVEYRRDGLVLLLLFNDGQPETPPNRTINALLERAYTPTGDEQMYAVVFRPKANLYDIKYAAEICQKSTITFIGAKRYERSISTTIDLRGITDILANDERIQINSCVTTPFRWKFRDEVEGITAEINLSLFFDSRCN